MEIQLFIKEWMNSLISFHWKILYNINLQSKVVPLGSKMNEVLTSDPMHLHWVLKHMMYIGKDEILVVA